MNETEQAIGTILIGNIDEDGYLILPVEEIAESLKVSEEQVEKALQVVQSLDPIGVGSQNLQECLLIQMRAAGLGNSLAERLVLDFLPLIQAKKFRELAKQLGCELEVIAEAYFIDTNQIIIPDVFVFKDEGEWVVLLNEDGLPRVRISPYYKEMMGGGGDEAASTKEYLEDKLRGAQWIIRSLDQRNKTILKVVHSLIHFQESFLDKGIQYLKPLVLKHVAEDVGMHESTISRVTTNKYMYCPQGMLELKFFFNAGIQRSDPGAEDLSSLTVREIIREMVAHESGSKPLKDQEIVARLKYRGIVIARRTVAKYRAELHIAPASQRKRIHS